jgi:hypothetical protein
MRICLNIAAGSEHQPKFQQVRLRRLSGVVTFFGAGKRKTRRWERRVRSYCYRSLRFQVCGLAVDHHPLGLELHVFIVVTAVPSSSFSFFFF